MKIEIGTSGMKHRNLTVGPVYGDWDTLWWCGCLSGPLI